MVWKGTVNGAIPGQLETRLISLRETGMIWHVEFDWIITGLEPGRFVHCQACWNTEPEDGKGGDERHSH
jgi:hypothetical protein